MEAVAAAAVAGVSLERLGELRRRIAEQNKLVDEVRRRLNADSNNNSSNNSSVHGKQSVRGVPVLLRAGGQGYRLWKAPHETLAAELASRAPPELASPVVRGESKRFQGKTKQQKQKRACFFFFFFYLFCFSPNS